MFQMYKVLFSCQYALIQMCHTPSLRHRKAEKLRQLITCLLRHSIAPCPERCQQSVGFIKRHISVHHSAYSDRAVHRRHYAVLRLDILYQRRIAILHTCYNIIFAVCPDTVFKSVFPLMRTCCRRRVVTAYKHSFNSCRPELNSKRCFSVNYIIFRFQYIHIPTSPCRLINMSQFRRL